MKDWKKHFVELVVIVFSILLAFWLENLRESVQTAKRKKEAIKQIVAEIEHNQLVLESNLQVLKQFNEMARILDHLNGEYSLGEQVNFEIDGEIVDSLRRAYPNNRYIQNSWQSSNGKMMAENDLTIDFILQQMTFGTWESSKSSGTLLGINQEILATISDLYSRLQTGFGYTEQDYHKAVISGYNEVASLEEILDATAKLEQVYRLKLGVLNSNYDDMISHLRSQYE